MTADTKMKQDIGYGAIDDTTNPETETSKTPTRTTYGILLFVMSVVLVVAGAGAAGATRSYLRYDTTASIVASNRDACDNKCRWPQQCTTVSSFPMGVLKNEYKCVELPHDTDSCGNSRHRCAKDLKCCDAQAGGHGSILAKCERNYCGSRFAKCERHC